MPRRENSTGYHTRRGSKGKAWAMGLGAFLGSSKETPQLNFLPHLGHVRAFKSSVSSRLATFLSNTIAFVCVALGIGFFCCLFLSFFLGRLGSNRVLGCNLLQ